MNLHIFELLNEDCADFDACMVEYRDSQKKMQEIKETYQARIAAQRRYADDRTKTLEAILRDASRTETARKMAQKELSSLEDCTYSPTQDEIAEYDEAKETAHAAIADLKKVIDDVRVSFVAAEKEIAKAKADTLNDSSFDINWMIKQLDNDSGLA